jgi:hypothetical protein
MNYKKHELHELSIKFVQFAVIREISVQSDLLSNSPIQHQSAPALH